MVLECLVVNKKYYQQRLLAKLCAHCGKVPARPGKVCCEKCNDTSVERNRRARKRRVQDGLCTRCGKTRSSHGTLCAKCSEQTSDRHRVARQRLRDETFAAYGGYRCSCPGCAVTEPKVLTIDHTNNDGAQHRRSIGATRRHEMTGVLFYAWLKKKKFPPGFGVMCMNCNFGKRMNGGVCPLHGKI